MSGADDHAVIGDTLADSVPHWPAAAAPPDGAPNILIVVFDDVGYSDFGCYGSEVATPTIDALAADGIRYAGFHTTAMCSTTRAALLTGRNHHSVGMGCLANFDSGFPGYRGKIARSAGTVAELLRPHGYRSYMVGKWHATRVTETGPTGPHDGWPLGRGFNRFYGFLDAETDQYSPELVRDNSHVTAPGDHASGYHLSADLADNAISMIADHRGALPDRPWLTWLALGACHAPHQAPAELIAHYDEVFAEGWDVTRDRRLARQIEMGLVPPDTELPPRNDWVEAWDTLGSDQQRVYRRLQGAYAAMLDHADRQVGRVVSFLADTGMLDDTLVVVLSDNGASQEGGPAGFVNAMGPYNLMAETMEDKVARIDDIGGPDTHSNFPWGWAMAANTPLKRYKQNTHGGGIRDPLVVRWGSRIESGRHGAVVHGFCHAVDVVPTLLDLVGIDPPTEIDGVAQQPIEGHSFANTISPGSNPVEPQPTRGQYFEMFGHRGLYLDGYKAVAYHQPGTPFADDRWELYHLDTDVAENRDLAEAEPERLTEMIDRWWEEARAHQVLPLDDRFAERFAENATRFHGRRHRYEFWAGMGHLPTDVAPDLRSRSYTITAEVAIPTAGAEGVLVAHGDMTSGYSLYIKDDRLVHDLNVGGTHHVVVSDREVPRGTTCRLSFRMRRAGGSGIGTLLIDGEPAGRFDTNSIFFLLISWSGLDIGLDRGSPVSHYDAPFRFTGTLRRVVVETDDDQDVDHQGAADVEVARD